MSQLKPDCPNLSYVKPDESSHSSDIFTHPIFSILLSDSIPSYDQRVESSSAANIFAHPIISTILPYSIP
jgi:hypothetical protein